MKRAIAIAALVAFSLSCEQKQEVAAPQPQSPFPTVISDADERQNLLNIAFGVSVVSRTAELTLDHSALRAIDGDPHSPWMSPPNDSEQTLTFALPAPATIDKVGIREGRAPKTSTRSVTFEVSTDGVTFTRAGTVDAKNNAELQLVDITPVTARFIRTSIGKTESPYSAVASLHARGRFVETPSLARIDGCWSFNGVPASFTEKNGRIGGVIKRTDSIQIDGAAEGPLYRLAWSRGPEAGQALITMPPDGQTLSGIKWHEEPVAVFFGDSWFGERAPCQTMAARPETVMRTWIRRKGRYPLYTLSATESSAAIDTIIEVLRRSGAHRLKLVSREHRQPTPQINLRLAQERLNSLREALQKRGVDLSRIDFEAAGSDRPHAPVTTEAARVLYSVIDLEVPAAARSMF